MIPAPSRTVLARIIAWRDSLYQKWAMRWAQRNWYTYDAPPPKKAKNPRRVEGGRKGALTRKANIAFAAYCAERGLDPKELDAQDTAIAWAKITADAQVKP